jgi:hypothetical protein
LSRALRMNVPGVVLVALLCPFAPSVSADEIYRWVDDQGVVNYTQQKPRGQEAEKIQTKAGTRTKSTAATPAAASPAATGLASGTEKPLSAEQQKMLEDLRRAEEARQEEVARIKEHNCQRSREVLTRLTVKNRIRVADESGEYRVMPEDERQQRISEAQENIALYCAQS